MTEDKRHMPRSNHHTHSADFEIQLERFFAGAGKAGVTIAGRDGVRIYI